MRRGFSASPAAEASKARRRSVLMEKHSEEAQRRWRREGPEMFRRFRKHDTSNASGRDPASVPWRVSGRGQQLREEQRVSERHEELVAGRVEPRDQAAKLRDAVRRWDALREQR